MSSHHRNKFPTKETSTKVVVTPKTVPETVPAEVNTIATEVNTQTVVAGSNAEADALLVEEQLDRLFRGVLKLSNASSINVDEQDEGDFADAPDENSHLADYLTASFLEARTSMFADCNEWMSSEEWLEPVIDWLKDADDDAAERISSESLALETLLEGLFAIFSLRSSTLAKYAVGDRVLAVLKQDKEWHEARVESIDEAGGAVTYHVRFIEYGAPQTLGQDDISFDPSWAEEVDDDDACKVCGRTIPLTFHHLVPRETHSHILRKNAKSLVPVVESLFLARPDCFKNKSRKDWLEVHGINVCRKCHSQIHRAESNMTLAMKFNTLELVLQHPDIIRWRAWARKQV